MFSEAAVPVAQAVDAEQANMSLLSASSLSVGELPRRWEGSTVRFSRPDSSPVFFLFTTCVPFDSHKLEAYRQGTEQSVALMRSHHE